MKLKKNILFLLLFFYADIGSVQYQYQLFELEIKNAQTETHVVIVVLLLFVLFFLMAFFLYRNHRNKLELLKKEAEYNMWIGKMLDYLTQLEKNIEIEKINLLKSKKVEIGENLHNEVLSGIVGVNFLIKDLIKNTSDTKSVKALHVIEDELEDVYTEARDFSHQLVYDSPTVNDIISIKDYILSIKSKFSEIGLLKISYECNDEEKLSNLPYKIEIVLYHILKESISNALKHAKSTQINILLHLETAVCRVHLYNDGVTHQEIQKKVGLNSLVKRIESLNGKIQFYKQNNYFHIDSEIPLI
ncbi:MAG: sensor histidine kinase [Flavobacteriales bacterium]